MFFSYISRTTYLDSVTEWSSFDSLLFYHIIFVFYTGLELIKYLKSIHFNYKSASKRLLTTAEANIDFVGFIINSLLEPVVHTSYLSSLPSNATVCNMGKSKNLPSPDDDLHFIHFSGHSDMDNTQAVLDLLGR